MINRPCERVKLWMEQAKCLFVQFPVSTHPPIVSLSIVRGKQQFYLKKGYARGVDPKHILFSESFPPSLKREGGIKGGWVSNYNFRQYC